MNETQQQQPQPQPRIDWLKSGRNLALGVWGFATYVALLGGIAWLAAAAGPNPQTVALLAVVSSTSLNVLLFGAIEHHARD
jgi:hypothetical protein